MNSIARFFRRGPPAAPGLIDVRELITRLSDAELLEAADGYFSQLTLDSEQCHKPFSNPGDAVHITRHLSLLLQAAELFPGADVLDFGCATGWLTLAIADLGCNAIGVDISPAAIALAEGIKARSQRRGIGSTRFHAYDGRRLPIADESLDRVLCFDAFHHVKDQAHAIREFARVLRPGGRVAMVEPGPNHSRTPQSQMEMSRYKVIENDVNMVEISAAAMSAGLSMPQMLFQFQKPRAVSADMFVQWTQGSEFPAAEARRLLSGLKSELTDTQSFFMVKGDEMPDSRNAGALAADIRLTSVQRVGAGGVSVELHFVVRNTGEAVWITEPGRAGQINLGSLLMAADGTVRDLNHGRYPLGVPRVRPGEQIDLVVIARVPPDPGSYLRFDLVSEHVAWFEQNGRCAPAEWRPAQ